MGRQHESNHDHDDKHKHDHKHWDVRTPTPDLRVGGCRHSHSAIKNIGIAFAINFIFALIELVGGFITGSVAVSSNAIHDLSDSLSLGLAFFFEKIAQRRPDNQFSFGYRRLSLLSALVSGLGVLGASVAVLFYTIPALSNPTTPHTKGMLVLALLGVVVNGFAALRLKKGHTANERMLAWHLIEDTLSWVAVLVVSLVMMFFDVPLLDPLLSLFIIVIVVRGVSINLWKTLKLFLQAVPAGMDLQKIKEEVIASNAADGVLDMHGTRAWSLDGAAHIMSTHVVVRKDVDVATLITIKGRINALVRKLGVGEVLTTIEFENEDEICQIKIHENI